MSVIYLANLMRFQEGVRTNRFGSLHFPTGLGIISGVLSTTNHDLRVVDNYVPGRDLEDILEEIEHAQPDFILFSGFLGNYQYGFFKRISRQIRVLSPNTIQVIGGPMATTVPELLINHSAVDYAVIGEGEETILDLLHAMSEGRPPYSVQGIAYRAENGRAVRTAPRVRMKDLSKYPLPKYELFNMDVYVSYLNKTGRCWEISTSRGCYASCKYCKLTFGKKITFRPVEHVIKEMKFIKRRYGIDRFNFVDDNFLNSTRQVEELVAALRACDEKFQFRFQGRADRINRHFAVLLRGAGCFGISFGLETGSQRMIDYMGKFLNVKKAEENLKEVLDEGINTHATFIVGMPIEDEQTIQETKDYIKRIGLPNVSAGILTPFPETAVYALGLEKGLIPDEDRYCEDLGVVYDDVYLNLTRWPDEQLRQWRDEIQALVPQREQDYISVDKVLKGTFEDRGCI